MSQKDVSISSEKSHNCKISGGGLGVGCFSVDLVKKIQWTLLLEGS